MIENISVIGIGRLGLAFSLVCENSGFNILGCDKNSNYISELNGKTFHSIEPHIEEYLQKSKNFAATISVEACLRYSDLLFLLVATPSLENGEYDHSQIESVIEQLIALHAQGAILRDKTLVIGCTVMPGYTQSVQDRLSKFGIDVCYNPEFIAQGDIVRGLENADMVLIGSHSRYATEKIKYVYSQIMGEVDSAPMCVMSPTAAEITKISINCFLTTKISFANMVGAIAINSGLGTEYREILQAIGEDDRIGNKFLKFGLGFQGICLPRDNTALAIYANKVGIDALIPKITDEFNKVHAQYIKNYFLIKNNDKSVPFIFDTIYYKKGTQLLIESHAYKLCLGLLDEGYTVVICDNDSAVLHGIKEDMESKYGSRVIFTAYTDKNISGINIEF